MQAPNIILEKNKRRSDDARYSIANHQGRCKWLDCLQYNGLKKLQKVVG